MREEEQHCGIEKGDEGCTAARDVAVQRTHGCVNASTEPTLGGRRLAFGLKTFIFDDIVEIAGFFSALPYRSAPCAFPSHASCLREAPLFDAISDLIPHHAADSFSPLKMEFGLCGLPIRPPCR